ncbi:MAG TPA: NAD(P)-dependent alcohol dehydrogenase [Pseudonocardiaceae bacterium]|jgi:aryl-alcohol dehydrogenase|nr:NAD(P)-dependent alcohol dehydrogenase [Pseudonocardiaceae bacterium]
MLITAAVLRANDAPHALETVEIAEPGANEVVVEISGVGLCHTDLMPRSPAFFGALPMIAGHEGSGVVTSVGSEVTGVAVGDHVIASFDHCRDCANCLTGHPAYCATFLQRNLFGRSLDGSISARDAQGAEIGSRWFGQSSFATHALVTEHNLVVVDPELPLELLGPLGCGVQTGAGAVFNALRVLPGSSFVVFGAGAVGLSAVMAATVAGATTIIAVDLNPARLAVAEELGATHVINAAEATDVIGELYRLTEGGAQYTLDTTGVPAVVENAINSLRPTGTCGLVAVHQGDVTITPSTLAFGRNVMGIFEGDSVPRLMIPRLIALWQQDRFPFDKLIRTFPLAEINAAEKASISGEVIKPVLLPGS